MKIQQEAAGLNGQTATTTRQNIIHIDLTDEEKEKIRRIQAWVKSILRKRAAKLREGKKPQTLMFDLGQNGNKNENKPKEEEENLDDPPRTSNSSGLPRAEDNATSTTSPDKDLEK